MKQGASKESTELFFFRLVTYHWVHRLPLKIVYFTSKIHLEETKFSLASDYHSEIASGLGLVAFVHFFSSVLQLV